MGTRKSIFVIILFLCFALDYASMLTLRRATLNDVAVLAQMNKRLVEDEGGSNPMSLLQLESRLRAWLTGEWRADLFVANDQVIGYAVHRSQRHEFDSQETVYIRHYFIGRDYRRLGFGREGLEKLKTERFPKGVTVYLEVLTHNARGRAFWKEMGFAEYSVTMRLEW
jgi:GNAT superfamily N-acetyltransferase